MINDLLDGPDDVVYEFLNARVDVVEDGRYDLVLKVQFPALTGKILNYLKIHQLLVDDVPDDSLDDAPVSHPSQDIAQNVSQIPPAGAEFAYFSREPENNIFELIF